MEAPAYAVCERCAFLRGFGGTASSSHAPERCPACGNEVRVHARRERFPSTYVGRIARKLHRVPPLSG